MIFKSTESSKIYKFASFAKTFAVCAIFIIFIFLVKEISDLKNINVALNSEYKYYIFSHIVYVIITIVLCLLIFLLLKIIKDIFSNKFSKSYEVDRISNVNYRSKFIKDASIEINKKKNKFVMIHLDIDKFKIINEMYGYKTGDKILSEIGKVFNENLKDEIFGKEDGDNFLALIRYDGIIDKITEKINKIVADIENLKIWTKLNVKPILMTGIYIIKSEEYILTSIDKAKSSKQFIKGGYKSNYAIYNDSNNAKLFVEKRIEDEMHEALNNREFKVYLQPKINLKDGYITGAEALVRWENSIFGLMQPMKFIPIFEKNGFIALLDKFVFEEVCVLLRKWLDLGYDVVPISVNVSRLQFTNKHFVEEYNEIKNKYVIPDGLIEIEITESVVFNNVESVFEIMRELKNKGFEISMDDFGSGYSSLGLLREMPIDTIKLDKVFLNHFGQDNALIILKDVVSLAKNLNLKVVSEGVETNIQADYLKTINCDIAQGYTFSRPLPVNEYESFICNKRKNFLINV